MRQIIGRAATVIALAGVGVFSAVAPASAALPWLAPVDVLTSSAAFISNQTAVAVAPDGTAYAAFTRTDAGPRVYVATRAPGEAFSAPIAISEAGADASGVKLAVDLQGNATIAWLRGGVVQAAMRRPGGSWSPVQTVSGPNAQAPGLAVGVNGGAALTWVSGSGVDAVVQAALRLPGGSGAFGPAAGASTFGSPVSVSAAAGTDGYFYGSTPSIAMDDVGDVIVMWVRNTNSGISGNAFRLVAETAEAKAAATPTFTVATPRSSQTVGGITGSFFNVAMTPAGKAIAVWEYSDFAPGTTYRLQYAERNPGANFQTAPWGASSNLAYTAGSDAEYPRAVVGRDGTVIVGFSHESAVSATVRPPGGAFSTPRVLSTGGGLAQSVAISPSGDALIVWPAGSAGDYTLYSAHRKPGASDFDNAVEIVRGSGTAPAVLNDGPQVAMDDQGDAFAVSRHTATASGPTPAQYSAQVTAYDAVAPTISGATVPTGATTGVGGAFSVTATDRIGPVTIAWDFGDGSTATGVSAEHAFAVPGVYTVKITATDAAGNATDVTRPVAVSAPPMPSPSPGTAGPAPSNSAPVTGTAAAAVLPTPGATASLTWTVLGSGRTTIKSLSIGKLAKGDVVSLACAPKSSGCRKAATTKTTLKKGTSVSFTKVLKGMTLAPGATLTIKIARAKYATQLITFKTVKKKKPAKTVRCQDPGAKVTRAC